MVRIEQWFPALAELAGVSLLVLAIGTFVVGRLKQPIERVRAIQWTLAAVIAAMALRQSGVAPLRIALLPARASGESNFLARQSADQNELTSALGASAATSTLAPSALAPTPIGTTSDAGQPAIDVERHHAAASASRWPSWDATFRLTCVVVAAIGGLFYIALWGVGRWRLARLLKSAIPVGNEVLRGWPAWPQATRRGARVLASHEAAVPMTFGVLRPAIVLPSQLVESSDQRQLVYCLAHEWAHVRGHDSATWAVVRLVQPLLWFQPLFWRLRRELRLCQDQLADDYAARGDDQRADYAELLVALARRRQAWGGMPALTITGRPSNLRRRIELLLTEGISLAVSGRRGVLAALAVTLTAAGIVLGTAQLERASAETAENADPEGTADQSGPVDAAPGAGHGDASPEPQGESLAFSGVVLDKETKRPINGAKVVVRRMILRAAERRIVQETEHTTNLMGLYSFEVPPEQTAEKAMYIELDVEHPDYAWKKGFGYSLTMIRKNLAMGEPPFFASVELDPAEPVTGVVADPNGNPLAEVNILAYSKGSATDFSDYGSFFRTKTDGEGRFTINAVKGGPCMFWIVPEKFAPEQRVIGSKRGSQGVIRVEQGVSLSGRVLSATGEPVAGAWVNYSDETSRSEIDLPVSSAMRRSALTDDNGEFTLRPMKAGKGALEVEDYPSEINYHDRARLPANIADIFVSQTIELQPADAGRPITIRAVPHVEFRGQYVDSKGQPCSGHEVMAFGRMGGQWFHRTLRPDANGKIVARLPHGLEQARLEAITNEHSAVQVRLKPDGPWLNPRNVELGVVEDDLVDVQIVRFTAPIVQIKVVDEQGNLVPDAKVAGVFANDGYELMHPVDGLPTHIFFEKQVDGRFRTSQMLPDTETTFTAKADGYEDASEKLSLPEGKEQELALVLKASTNSGNGAVDAGAEMVEKP